MNTHKLHDIFWSLWDFHYPQKYHPYKHFLGNLGKLYFQWLVLLKTLKPLDSHTHVKEGWLLVNNTFAKCLAPATKCWRLFIVTCHNCPNLFKTFLRLQLQDKIFQSIKSGKQAFRPQLSNNDSSDVHLFPSLPQRTMHKLRLRDKLQENANVICFHCKTGNSGSQSLIPCGPYKIIPSNPISCH